MARIFLTGATGYVGGEALSRIASGSASRHQIACLVRDAAKGGIVSKAYPNVRIVSGDLEDSSLIEKEASKADVVINLASTSNATCANAIAKGLTTGNRDKPAHWIQISGASLLCADEISNGRFGEKSDKVYDDLNDIDEIRKIIQTNPKRVVDNLVLSQPEGKVKTALIVGPLIYGPGSGPVNQRSIQGPEIAKYTLNQGRGFRLAAGLNSWSNIHVRDLGKLIVALLEATKSSDSDSWNQNGIFIPENGKMTFGDLCAKIAGAAHSQGFIKSSNIDNVITPKEADNVTPHGSVLLGTNANGKSSRARKVLDWQPSEPSLEDEIPGMVKYEAEKLGLTK